jgi:hypothetical protein
MVNPDVATTSSQMLLSIKDSVAVPSVPAVGFVTTFCSKINICISGYIFVEYI